MGKDLSVPGVSQGEKSKTRVKHLSTRMVCQVAGAGVGAVLAVALLSPVDAGASDVLLQFNQVYSGTIPPTASPPWVDATFQDVTGGVLATIANVGLSSGEFVSKVYFNLNPTYDPSGPGSLTFTLQSQSGDFVLPELSKGRDAYKADGDGFFDFRFAFSTQDGGELRFDDSEVVSYLISGISGLQASDFVYHSAGSSGGLYGAAHIQGIDSGANSVWASATIPEPSQSILLVLGVSLWAGVRLQLNRPKAA